MLRIAAQFLWHKRKRLALLPAVILLSLALLFVVGPLFDAAKARIYDLYTARYGRHYGAILHLNGKKLEMLEEKRGEVEIAYFKNYGSRRQEESGQNITCAVDAGGFMDCSL